jgi:hypothetical protein
MATTIGCFSMWLFQQHLNVITFGHTKSDNNITAAIFNILNLVDGALDINILTAFLHLAC